jgi:hypothetical protein
MLTYPISLGAGAVGHDGDVMKLAGILVGGPLSDREPPRLAWRRCA